MYVLCGKNSIRMVGGGGRTKKKFNDARRLPLFIYHNRIFGSQNVKVTRKAVAILLLFIPLGSALATKMSNGSLRNVLHRICSLFKSLKDRIPPYSDNRQVPNLTQPSWVIITKYILPI